ncbi:DUF362 domain-containing protein [Sinanaerobacter sp. ZZT-01]|uniref:DUF362 domain-containing protein n=1 Tax=Sinanaerobacter sp. ZZT-01 TaxID=3111540 RepID=UPI002D78DB36|nr:DUF362 domain-containing protein [Sinanaerobacter sp. ZZT-01]WRR93048.1 DUF362 domain-containing protein [Sinanaerobacter sp. ZZT-01]
MQSEKNHMVSLLSCIDYQYEAVKSVIDQSVKNLGGWHLFVLAGEKVLLKVNLVMKKTPESAATSHPVFVRAISDLLIEQGVQVLIGDSPGGPFTVNRLHAIYQVCGMKEAAERSGAELNYNIDYSEVKNPNGLLLKKLTNIDVLRSVDKVINLSKLKTHGMMRMTGAVKNMFGTIPGTLKAEYHLNRPEPENFADALIDIYLCANPVLSLIDGIVAMEGDGPTSGTPRSVGVVIASQDAFSMDLAASAIISAAPKSIPTVKRSIDRGLCPSDISKITFIGDALESFILDDFKAPAVKLVNPLMGNYPLFVKKIVDYTCQPRPVFLHEKCIGCEDCYKNCPPTAITMQRNRPEVDLGKCIRCFCCQELCPKKAVEIKRPLLFRFIAKL